MTRITKHSRKKKGV